MDADIGSTTATYQWQLDGVDLAGETSSNLSVSSPNDGTYSVIVEDSGCTATDSVLIEFVQDDSSFDLTPTCDGAVISSVSDPGGIFEFVTNPGPGISIDPTSGEITGADYEQEITIKYTTNGACPSSSEVTFSTLVQDDSSFTMLPTCQGATATITGDLGGYFQFDQIPSDSAILDPDSGTITNGTPGNTYFVSYTT